MVIYEKQKEKGGIIDLEEERKKNLITENTVVVLRNELENLVVEPSTSSVNHLSTEDVRLGDVGLDVPPGLEHVIGESTSGNVSHKRGTGYYHRGRGRGRRFHDGHYRARGRGDRREPRGEHKPSGVNTTAEQSSNGNRTHSDGSEGHSRGHKGRFRRTDGEHLQRSSVHTTKE